MCRIETSHHAYHSTTEFIISKDKTLVHLVLCNKRLNNTQSTKSFFYLRHNLTKASLHIRRLTLQPLTNGTHYPCCRRSNTQHEQCQLPADSEQCSKTKNDCYRLTNQIVHTRRDRTLHHLDISTHTYYDITLALRTKETKGQLQYLVI